MINVAINGFGRIGRNILRALYERPDVHHGFVLSPLTTWELPKSTHLLQFDTTHGRFGATVAVEDGALNVNGDRIAVFAERNPEDLPWGDLKLTWCLSAPASSRHETRHRLTCALVLAKY